MRYTRRALLIFGIGLAFGFVVVVGELHYLERPAAALMVLGIIILPAAMAIDWRRGAKALRMLEQAPAKRGRAPARRAAAPTGRKAAAPRKSPRPRRAAPPPHA